MITNERQYRISKAQLEKIKESMDSFDLKKAVEMSKSKRLANAELDALKSEIENLIVQITEYETLKSGSIEILKASDLEELPKILIRARIVKDLTQRELAELLGLKEQQIQRYEAEDYASAKLSRLAEVAKALELNIREIAEFNNPHQTTNIDIEGLALDQFPIKEMFYRNWFEGFYGSVSQAIENSEELLLEFLSNALEEPKRVLTRQRIRAGATENHYALIAWQCRIIILAKKCELKNKFKKSVLTDEWFNNLVHLSREADGPRKARDFLADYGIPLVVEPHLSKTHLDGAAVLLSNGQPVIGMTLRYDRISNFWFVLVHELVHIKKHLSKGDIESIFDDLDKEANDIEQEADEDASEILIPADKWETTLARYVRNEDSIRDFAEQIGVHPAIVAGKIQYEARNYVILNDMVGRGEVRKLFSEVEFSY